MLPAYDYEATCQRVIDGDTFVANIDLGFRIWTQLSIRLYGVDAPERSDRVAGAAATAFVRETIGEVVAGTARPLVLRSYKDKQSFSRWVAEVWVVGDDASLGERLVESGHAVVYPG